MTDTLARTSSARSRRTTNPDTLAKTNTPSGKLTTEQRAAVLNDHALLNSMSVLIH
jgi:hypothetical protein